MIEDFEIAKHMLTFEEADERYLYDDATAERIFAPDGHVSGGIGHNFDARPLSDAVVDLLFSEDWAIAVEGCKNVFSFYAQFSQPRRLAILNMMFNLGVTRFKSFKQTIAAFEIFDFEAAAEAAKNSLWYVKAKGRGERVYRMIKDDIIPPEYFHG